MLRAVDDVLDEIGAEHTPRLLVLNKADALDAERREELRLRHPDGVLVSALDGEGLDELQDRVERAFRARCGPSTCSCPSPRAAGWPSSTTSPATSSARTPPTGVRVRARVPAPVAERYARFAVADGAADGRPAAANGSAGRATGPRPPRPVRLGVRRLHPAAVLPARAHDGDAGLDLVTRRGRHAARPGARASVPTGLAVELPPGHAGLVLPRSGLALRHGVALVNAPGLIDAGYRGEVRVLLLNTDREHPVTLRAGDRVAQLVVVAVAAPEPVELDELGATAPRRRRLRLQRRVRPGWRSGAGGERRRRQRPGYG